MFGRCPRPGLGRQAKQLARTLGDVLGDEARRATLGDRAHERVIDRFLPDTQLESWNQLIANLVHE